MRLKFLPQTARTSDGEGVWGRGRRGEDANEPGGVQVSIAAAVTWQGRVTGYRCLTSVPSSLPRVR